ncbi:MAG: type II secretion system F family protein [Candidatus Omnitrophota bacterium]
MPKYAYRAKGAPKEVLEGVIEAESEEAVLRELDRLGYYPLSIEEKEPVSASRFSFSPRSKILPRDVTVFSRQLSDLLGSGVPLARSLDLLSHQTESRPLRIVIEDIQRSVREGGAFSRALMRHPKVFSSLYVGLVEAGEMGGALENVLDRLADFGEKEQEMRSKVVQALAYPLLICAVGFITILFLLIFVMPRIAGLFEDLQAALPLPTQILISVSHFVSSTWGVLLALVLIGVAFFRRLGRMPGAKLTLDRFRLKVPLFGDLLRKSEIARFGRTLGTLVANGVPVLRAIEIVSKTMENQVLRQETERSWREVREGATLSGSLARGTAFPAFVTNMVAVGEESGALDRSLFKVADAFDREADRTARLITTFLEPLMILTVAVLVGFIVISMLLPIFQLQGIVG